jgi:hypothetical protein
MSNDCTLSNTHVSALLYFRIRVRKDYIVYNIQLCKSMHRVIFPQKVMRQCVWWNDFYVFG